MPCPVCESAARTEVYVEAVPESTLRELADNPGGKKKMARCDGCGVIYDHRMGERDGDTDPTEKVNCPECGARIAADLPECSYCEAPLEDETEADDGDSGLF